MQRLAYLADIFAKLNELNLSLQGKNITVFSAHDKITALSRKLQFWHSCIENSNTECFPTLHDWLSENSYGLHVAVREEISEHLQELQENFTRYFPQERVDNSWIKNPFHVTEKPTNLSALEYENLLELTSDSTLKLKYAEELLINFWDSLIHEFPAIAKQAVPHYYHLQPPTSVRQDFHIMLPQRRSTEIDLMLLLI